MVSLSSFSRKARSNSGADGIENLRDRSVRGYALDDGGKNRLRGLPVGVRVEVEDNAMPQHGWGDALHILNGEVIAATHESEDAAALDQGLGAARRAAVADILAGE